MKCSKRLVTISLFVVLVLLLSACSNKGSESIDDKANPAETTVVIETTVDGGAIEQDSEGNRITKDEKGNIISVEDKAGKPVDVESYISTHSWVVGNDSTVNTGSLSPSGNSDNSGKAGESGGKSSSESSSGSSSGTSSPENDDVVEESIPVIVVTIPDEEDMSELPDF